MVFKFTGVYYTISLATGINTTIAVPATILCINRRLYLLASQTSVIPSKADKNRELIIDLVIGIGLPMVVMALCLSSNFSIYFFGLSIFSIYHTRRSIYHCWRLRVLYISHPYLGLSHYYPYPANFLGARFWCLLNIRAHYNRSKLNETHNILNPDRSYIRLIYFSAVDCDILCGIPMTVFYLYRNVVELVPFPGYKQFSLIYQVPAVEWRADMLN